MLRLEGPSKATQPTPSLRPGPLAYPLPGRKGVFPPPARPVCYVQSVMGKRVAGGGELVVHQREWEGELERASSPGGAPPPRLDEACAPAPPVHALGASNRLGQVFMVRRSVPYHAFMPRRSASASPPCSCSRAGAFFWGGLAHTGRDGGRGWPPPAPQVHWALPHCSILITSSVSPCSDSPLRPWRQHSRPAWGHVPRSNFRAAVQVWGAPWDGCTPSLMCVAEGGATLPDQCRVGARRGRGRDSALGLGPPCPTEIPLPAPC